MAAIDDLQSQASALLGTAPSAARAVTQALVEDDPGPPFSAFIPAQLTAAVEVAQQLVTTADDIGGEDGLAAALDEARRLATEHPPQLVQHALQLFIVHHPQGSRLSIPPIEPIPSDERRPAFTADQEETDAETELDYLREDLLANEHHRHWHAVYPAQGWQGRRQDRQGELFFYMHQQMLARYDAERRALGLDPVEPFDHYRGPIGQGYGDRPPDKTLVDVSIPDQVDLAVGDLEAQRNAIVAAIQAGQFTGDSLIESLDALGQVEEPQRGSPFNGWHHGAGHIACAWVMHPDGSGEPGLIGDTRTAIRDPFFWRWHRHVDNFAFALQEQFDPHAYDDAPKVELRSDDDEGGSGGDLILCFEDQLPAAAQASDSAAAAWAQETFGDDTFDLPANAALSTDTLETQLAETPFDPNDPQTVPVSHLTHRAFGVAVRIRSTAQQDQRVTVRLFLAPIATAADRRAWIELDKFVVNLEAEQRAVAWRPMRLSSVVRKPTTPEPQFIQPPTNDHREQYCRCGWPYHLLVPRGTKEGMPFRLAAIVTDFAVDDLRGNPDCGSLSFCGSLDDTFPDTREMGYPFNRPFAQTIEQILAQQPSMAARHLKVRHGAPGQGIG